MAKMLMEYQSGEPIEKVLLVRETQLKTARNGNLYMDMQLADRSGALPAKLWDTSRELFDTVGQDDFVAVVGRVETYRNRLQLNLNSVIRCDPSIVDKADFLPTTENDIDEMYAELLAFVGQIENPDLRALMDAILADDHLREGLRTAPAAVQYHHPYIGGLLEHTVGVCRLTQLVIEQHPALDADLLRTAAALHDLGKVDEFTYDLSFRYSDQGQLLGHLIIAMLMIEEKVRSMESFPAHLLDMLRHLILSHHGEYEWGSPKLPMTAEAIALHHIDNLDAKLNAFRRAVELDPNAQSNWTEWSRMFERRLYKWQQGPEKVD